MHPCGTHTHIYIFGIDVLPAPGCISGCMHQEQAVCNKQVTEICICSKIGHHEGYRLAIKGCNYRYIESVT